MLLHNSQWPDLIEISMVRWGWDSQKFGSYHRLAGFCFVIIDHAYSVLTRNKLAKLPTNKSKMMIQVSLILC